MDLFATSSLDVGSMQLPGRRVVDQISTAQVGAGGRSMVFHDGSIMVNEVNGGWIIVMIHHQLIVYLDSKWEHSMYDRPPGIASEQ